MDQEDKSFMPNYPPGTIMKTINFDPKFVGNTQTQQEIIDRNFREEITLEAIKCLDF